MQKSKNEISTNSMSAYLANRFRTDMKRSSSGVMTGYSNIDDDVHGLQPGIYVLAAAPSIGKTTFVIQMAEQMAQLGSHVVVISMEHNHEQVAAQGLARRLYRLGYDGTSRDVVQGLVDADALDAAISQYEEDVGDRLNVVSGIYSAAEIVDYVEQYTVQMSTTPVLIIDYLQYMKPDSAGTTREQIDDGLQTLKDYSLKRDMTIIAVSSVSRTFYYVPVSMDSMKETGGCEYSAHVVWGLQLDGVGEIDETARGSVAARQVQLVDSLKAAAPRKMELVVIKDKMGKSGFSYKFDFWPEHSVFAPAKNVKRL